MTGLQPVTSVTTEKSMEYASSSKLVTEPMMSKSYSLAINLSQFHRHIADRSKLQIGLRDRDRSSDDFKFLKSAAPRS